VDTTTATLVELNAQTFRAENREGDWELFLRQTLAEDFVLRRANRLRPDEDAETTVVAIANDTRTRRLLEESVRVAASETLGVVISVVELSDPPTPDDRFFQNVKVFRRSGDDDWRLSYWQVSGRPAP
jgi:hypothetical protein